MLALRRTTPTRLPWATVLAALLPFFAALAGAHYVSISTGELELAGRKARVSLRMPAYELIHTRNPEQMLIGSVRLRANGEDAKLSSHSCRLDEKSAAFLCEAEYIFPNLPGRVTVGCRFHTVTVPNHVHVLRVRRETDGGIQQSQVVFDLARPETELRFSSPSKGELALREAMGGAARAAGGILTLLLLAVCALAAETRRALLLQVVALSLGSLAGALAVGRLAWIPAPRLLESAVALMVCYLAADLLIIPRARKRWMVVAVVGFLAGASLGWFLRESGSGLLFTLCGAVGAQSLAMALFGSLFLWLRRLLEGLPAARALAALFLVLGGYWFLGIFRGQ